jgi:hypothetical protein
MASNLNTFLVEIRMSLVFLGFRRNVDEISALLGCYTANSGKFLSIFFIS